MATTIVPTFDFAVNDIPRQATMRQQAFSLAIDGVSLENLEAGIRAVQFGDVSGATNALLPGAAVGTLWIDAQGNIWAQEQSGPVVLRRAAGGYETRRYWTVPSALHTSIIEPGAPIAVDGIFGATEDFARDLDNDTRASGTPVLEVWNGLSYDNNRNGRGFGLAMETVASSYIRILVRGVSVQRDLAHADSRTWSTFSDLRSNYRLGRPEGVSGARSFDTYYFASGSQDLTAHRHHVYRAAPWVGSSVVSNANPNLNSVRAYTVGYCFGLPQYSNMSN